MEIFVLIVCLFFLATELTCCYIKLYKMPVSIYYERLAELQKQIESYKRKMVKLNEDCKMFHYYEEKILSLEIEISKTLKHINLENEPIFEGEIDIDIE